MDDDLNDSTISLGKYAKLRWIERIDAKRVNDTVCVTIQVERKNRQSKPKVVKLYLRPEDAEKLERQFK